MILRREDLYRRIAICAVMSLAVTLLITPGCGETPTTTPTDDRDTEASEVITYKGTVSGGVSESRSTRESLDTDDGENAGQALPLNLASGGAVVTFEDLEGNPLLDANGDPYPAFTTDEAGEFFIEGLPVGIDFVIVIDLDGDGNPDIQQICQIPADDGGSEGSLDDVAVDPLSTLLVSMLKQVFIDNGIDPAELDISPTAIIHRIIDAYIHLFEESGIEREVTLEDIAALDDDSLTALFESLLPSTVRAGFETVEGNIALAGAADVEGAVRAAADVFLHSGFPIADDSGGIDLSFLADLPDVEIQSMDDLATVNNFVPDNMEPAADEIAPAGVGDELFDIEPPTVYVSTMTEPDRNYVGEQELEEGMADHHLPALSEHLLTRMVELHLEGRMITLGNLYRLLTDIEIGLGARLTYNLPMPGDGASTPMMMFQTADGTGTARDVNTLMEALAYSGLSDPNISFEDLQAQEAMLREAMAELLDGTEPPTFDQLFGAFADDRIEGVEELSQFIRDARAHLPVSRSGPASFYVVADGNAYGPDGPIEVQPITVDILFDETGVPISVNYNADGAGPFYLGFTYETDELHIVQPIVIETGHFMHTSNGEPMMLDMDDGNMFEPIDGIPFIEFVAETGEFWPGLSVSESNPEFEFAPAVEDPAIEPAEMEPENGMTMQLYVLATAPAPDGAPVRVDYDVTTETFTYNDNGRYYVTFLPETYEQGVFGLFDTDLKIMPTVLDLSGESFVDTGVLEPEDLMPPPDDPMPFDDSMFPDDYLPPPDDQNPPPDDGTNPPPDDGMNPPPDDGMNPPPDDGTNPPPDDGTNPPPDDGQNPPPDDGPVNPAEDTGTDGDAVPPEDETEEPPFDGDEPPIDGDEPPIDGTEPPLDGGEPIDGMLVELAKVTPDQIVGLDVQPEFFTCVFGTDVGNPSYNADGNPYFDDVNGNGLEDMGEYTSDFRPVLFNPEDWRSTDVARYYRRESGGSVTPQDVDFESSVPQTMDGEALVPRNYIPRLNAFRYGRPNSAINLLTTFMAPEFFNGTQGLDENTELGILQAVATINLVLEQVFNVDARIDIDGEGPLEEAVTIVDAYLFVMPVGDPFVLLIEGFEQLSTVPAPE